jgi:ABC-type amino acid transport substrate-binding protein
MRWLGRLNPAIRRRRLLCGAGLFTFGMSATPAAWPRLQPAVVTVNGPGTAVCRQPTTSGDDSQVEARLVLAPSGTLRVGVFPSPTSILHDPVSGEVKGVTVAVGRELARRLGVAMELV